VPIPCEFTVRLEPGETHLQWRFDGTPRLPEKPDVRALGFRVADIVVEEQ
jgi:hypothetical protein